MHVVFVSVMEDLVNVSTHNILCSRLSLYITIYIYNNIYIYGFFVFFKLLLLCTNLVSDPFFAISANCQPLTNCTVQGRACGNLWNGCTLQDCGNCFANPNAFCNYTVGQCRMSYKPLIVFVLLLLSTGHYCHLIMPCTH